MKGGASTLALSLTLASAFGAQSAPRWSRAQVELIGPLEALQLVGARSTTSLTLALAPGERRAAVVPSFDASFGAAPALTTTGAGSARFAAWDDAYAAAGEAWWQRVAPGLRARPLPRIGEEHNAQFRAPLLALLLALAALPVALATRRRPSVCAACALALAAGVVAAVVRVDQFEPRVRVLEGDGFGNWIAVDAAVGELTLDTRLPQRISGERQALHFEIAAALDGRDATVRVAGGRLWRALPLEPGERRFARTGNDWGELSACWLREPDGAWSARGKWPAGQPLPAAEPSLPQDPPGWINPALPQGTSILIGELTPGAYAGDDPRLARVWVRITALSDH